MTEPMETLGQLQQSVMDEVWRMGRATVADVHASLSLRRKIAYTTVLTTMRNLERRGMLTHQAVGKAFLYQPVMARDQYTGGALQGFVERVFGGQPEQLLCHLLGTERLTSADLERLKKMVQDR